jgi:outer membrane protein assembly factor BamB
MLRGALCWFLLIATIVRAEPPAGASPASAAAEFDGVWLGEIVGPNARTPFGLAFTPTPRGRLVSVYFPEMFLFSANFGEAKVRGGTFELPVFGLVLTLEGAALRGTFTAAKLPVELRRGGNFLDEPVAAEVRPAPAPAWTLALGASAWASPMVADEIIYVGTTDGRMHAVSASGQPLWTWAGPVPIYGTAAVSADTVFFVDARNDLVALARTDGSLRWRTPLRRQPSSVANDPTFNHRTATPVLDSKGVLYVGTDDGALCAIRVRNGKLAWRHELGAPVHAAVALAGDEVWLGAFDGTVRRVNRRTQKETLRVKLGGPVVSAPVPFADRVIIGCRDYTLYAISTVGGIAWRDTYWFSWVESTPRIADGMLYIGGSDYRRVSALHPETGARLWSTDVGGLSWGTPVVAGNTVFAATAGQAIEGTVIAHRGAILALDRRTGRPKWRYAAGGSPGADFTGFAGSLALAGDRLIAAGLDGTLLALPIEAP